MQTLIETREKPARQTRLQAALDALGRAIITGEFATGSTLPPENDLAAKLDVGRGTLREAVKSLVSKGMLDVSPRRGTRVRPSEHWNMLDKDVSRWAQAQPALLQQLSDFRLAIEPHAAALAAQHITRLEAVELMALLERMEQAKSDSREAVEADLAFHQKILLATHNAYFISMRHALVTLLRTSFQVSTGHGDGYEKSIAMHQNLADAICAGKAEDARLAAEQLILRHREDISEFIGQPSQAG